MKTAALKPDQCSKALQTGDSVLVFSRLAQAWVDGEAVNIVDQHFVRVEYSLPAVGEDLFGKTLAIDSEHLAIPCIKNLSQSSSDEHDPEAFLKRKWCVVDRSLPRASTSLRSYFTDSYRRGIPLEQSDAQEYELIEDQPPVFLHRPTGIKIWDMMLDLRSVDQADGEAGELLWHYTNQLAFLNITNVYHECTELWASLKEEVQDKEQPDTGFGEGVYASKREPADWRCKEEILINNFCGLKNFEGRADYCVPLLVPRGIINPCTKMVLGKHMGMDTQEHFRKHIFSDEFCEICQRRRRPSLCKAIDNQNIVSFQRDVWCIRALDTEGRVQHASANIKEKLMLRVKQLELLGPTSLETLRAYDRLAWCLNALGEKKKAEYYHRRVLDGRKEFLGDRHCDTYIASGSLGLCLRWQHGKENKEARALLKTASEGLAETLGLKHVRTLEAYHNYACVLDIDCCKAKAEELHRYVYDGYTNQLGDEHPQTLTARGTLGQCLSRQKKHPEATELLQTNVARCEQVMGNTHPKTLTAYNVLSNCLFRQSAYSKAEDYARLVFDGNRRVLGNGHIFSVMASGHLAQCLSSQRKKQEALPLYEQCLDGLIRLNGMGHRTTVKASRDLDNCRKFLQT